MRKGGNSHIFARMTKVFVQSKPIHNKMHQNPNNIKSYYCSSVLDFLNIVRSHMKTRIYLFDLAYIVFQCIPDIFNFHTIKLYFT